MVERTTMTVHKDVHERLEELKPHDSMSFNELLKEMAEHHDSSHDGRMSGEGGCPNSQNA